MDAGSRGARLGRIGVGREGICSGGAIALGGAKVIVILGGRRGHGRGRRQRRRRGGARVRGAGSGAAVDVTVSLGISGAGTAVLVCGRVLGGAVGRVVGRTGAGGGATALRGVTISLVALMGATDLCGREIHAIVAPKTTSGTPISRVVSSANRCRGPVVTSARRGRTASRSVDVSGSSAVRRPRPDRECGFEMLKSVSAQVNRILSRVRRRSQAGAGMRTGCRPQ